MEHKSAMQRTYMSRMFYDSQLFEILYWGVLHFIAKGRALKLRYFSGCTAVKQTRGADCKMSAHSGRF